MKHPLIRVQRYGIIKELPKKTTKNVPHHGEVYSVRKFFTTPQMRAVVEAGMAKDEEFERTSAYNELSKTLDKFLNNFDQKSYDAYTVMVGGGRHDKKVDVVDDRENKIDDKDRKSDELFLSLQNKKGKDYYDTVDILSKRVADGRANLYGIPPEDDEPISSRIPAAIEIIARDRGGVSSSEGVRKEDDGSRHKAEIAVEEWAKSRGYWKDEEQIKKNSDGGKIFSHGSEARVYLSKDRSTVTKVVNPYVRSKTELADFMEEVRVFNHLFPESAYNVVGATRDANGEFRVVMEQPRISGKQVNVSEYLHGGYMDKVKEYFSKFGLTQNEDLVSFSNGMYYVKDIHNGNVIFDKNGKPHIIDADAKYHGRYRRENIAGKPVVVDNNNGNVPTSTDDNTNGPHFRVATSMDEVGRPQSESVVEYRVQKLGRKLGTHVNMIYEAEDIPDPKVKASVEAGKKVTGWYDEKTGKVYLYMPNVKDTYTAEKTIWHEVVGHKGLRGLFGSDFTKLMRTLWYDIDSPINKELKAYVSERMKKDPMSIYDAIEEYLADAAEKGKGERGFWNYIKNKMSDLMHAIGYRISPNVKDVKYLLWLSKNYQKL